MEETVTDNPENAEEPQSEDGNFFSRYGKIFLYSGIILLQTLAAYGVYHFYYTDIQNWIGSFESEERYFYAIEDVIINPAESNGERYLILTVVVEVESNDEMAMLEQNNAQIIDNLNIILSTKTAQELISVESRNRIKQEIGVMVNETLNQKVVRNLFITKYVLQ